MPSVSEKQAKFMRAVAKNPEVAKKAGVPQAVGEDYMQADKGKKIDPVNRPDLQGVNKQKTNHGGMNLFKKGGVMAESRSEMKKEMAADKKQDVKLIKKAFKEHDAQEHKGGKGTKISLCKGGMMKKMAKGGSAKETMGPRSMKMDIEKGSNKLTSFGQSKVQKRGMTKGKEMGVSGPTAPIQKMRKGGGVEVKGKTRGRVV
jgi:hypothetical protein